MIGKPFSCVPGRQNDASPSVGIVYWRATLQGVGCNAMTSHRSYDSRMRSVH